MIAFIAAESREFAGLESRLDGAKRLALQIDYAMSGRLGTQEVVLLANGPGRDLARKAVASVQGADAYVSVGFCGALSEGLGPSEVFVADSVNGVRVEKPRRMPEAVSGRLLSLNRVVSTVQEKVSLATEGDAVEMEAAGVLEIAGGKARFCCVRVVTDTACENLPMDFNRMRDGSGRFSRTRIVFHALRNPWRFFPALMQLDRRCKSAAWALGDFLANCEF